MESKLLAGAAALAVCLIAGPAWADDPNDPAMRDPAARARDRAIIRKLNLDQLAYVRQRDAQLAPQWQAWRERYGDDGADLAEAAYARARAEHERAMAQWRRTVAACNSGDWDACERR